MPLNLGIVESNVIRVQFASPFIVLEQPCNMGDNILTYLILKNDERKALFNEEDQIIYTYMLWSKTCVGRLRHSKVIEDLIPLFLW